MFVLRPVRKQDFEGVYELSTHAKAGLTTLPHDPEVIGNHIQASLKAFELFPRKPGGESYFFVLEDLETHKIAGTSAIVSKVGGFQPFWTYELKSLINESKVLNVKKEIKYLQLKEIHNGPTEIGSLLVAPDYRRSSNGRLLSLGRFLFMSLYPQCFEATVLAEMRGIVNEAGESAFWEALGRHFFDVDYTKADYMVMKDKTFIADLMPRHPIYIALLPLDAQQALNKPHPLTEPALKLLEQEGFSPTGEIDIFEGGPIISCPAAEIRSIKNSILTKVT